MKNKLIMLSLLVLILMIAIVNVSAMSPAKSAPTKVVGSQNLYTLYQPGDKTFYAIWMGEDYNGNLLEGSFFECNLLWSNGLGCIQLGEHVSFRYNTIDGLSWWVYDNGGIVGYKNEFIIEIPKKESPGFNYNMSIIGIFVVLLIIGRQKRQ